MHPKTFASVSGILLLVTGVLALLPSMVGSVEGLVPLSLDNSYGMFMGFMPLNLMSKVALILFGITGLYASRNLGRELPSSIAYSRAVFILMGALSIMGLIPSTNTFFGYMPLYGANSAFFGVISLMGAYFGYALSSQVPADRTGAHPTRESLAH